MIRVHEHPGPGPDRRYWRRWTNRHVRSARRTRALGRATAVVATHLVIVAALVVTGVRAAGVLVETPTLALRTVDVRGAQRCPAARVRASLAPLLGRNLLSLRLAEVEERLAAEPWIHTASVKRVLPHGIRVELTERRPVAVALLGGTAQVVDRDGTVIGPSGPDLADDLPVITGIDAAGAGRPARQTALARGVEAVLRLAERAPAWALTISEVDVSQADRVAIVTAVPGPRILLDPAEVERNVDSYLAMRAQIEERVGPTRYVDLRWSGRITLLPSDGDHTTGGR